MKKFKSLIIMLTVLVLLVMVYLVASPMWSEDEADETSAEPTHTVAVIDHTTLVGLDLTVGSETLSFALNDTATEWDWSEDSEVQLDNVAFATLVTSFNEAGSKYKLENVTEDQLAEYGLADPAITVKFSFSDGTAKEYKIGNLNSFNGLYYLSESGAPNTVYMIDSSVVYSLELDIYDFVLEETPPAITESNIISFTFSTPRGDRAYSYYPTGNDSEYTDKYLWYFTDFEDIFGQTPLPVDGDIADMLVDWIIGMSFDSCISLDYNTDSSEFDFTTESSVIIKYKADPNETGVLSEQTYVLHIGNIRQGDIVVHTDNSKLVYRMENTEDWYQLLHSEREQLAADEIWLPNYELIDSLTFTAGENTLTVNVKNTDGKISYSSDVTENTDSLTALLEALDGLKAISNVAYLEDDAAAVEKTDVFTVKIAFNAGSSSELELKVSRYSLNYCLVSFNGREDQLITLEDAEKLVGMISAFFAEETKAA